MSTVSRTTTTRPKFSLADLKTSGDKLPGRYCFYGVPGAGKTSLGAMMPSPVFIQTQGETGLETLIDAGQLPETPFFPMCDSWEQLLSMLDTVASEDHTYKTLVLDTLNGAEKLLNAYVDSKFYDGQMSKSGFMNYQNGYEQSATVIRTLLNALDTIRTKKRMAIALLAHSDINKFRNPRGQDFDKYGPRVHKMSWAVVEQWVDAVLFMDFETATKEEKGSAKAKGVGGRTRIMYCCNDAAYVAKNRYGLPDELILGDSPKEAWKTFSAALVAGRKQLTKESE